MDAEQKKILNDWASAVMHPDLSGVIDTVIAVDPVLEVLDAVLPRFPCTDLVEPERPGLFTMNFHDYRHPRHRQVHFLHYKAGFAQDRGTPFYIPVISYQPATDPENTGMPRLFFVGRNLRSFTHVPLFGFFPKLANRPHDELYWLFGGCDPFLEQWHRNR